MESEVISLSSLGAWEFCILPAVGKYRTPTIKGDLGYI